MTKTQDKSSGGCLCGAIRYEAKGTPVNSNYCHCASCRKHAGALLSRLLDIIWIRYRLRRGNENSMNPHQVWRVRFAGIVVRR